jgi:hypothetical protein
MLVGWAAFAAAVLLPAMASAQQVATSFAQLHDQQTLAEGDSVEVLVDLTGDGEHELVKAQFFRLNDTHITLGFESLPQGRIENAERHGGQWRVDIPEGRVRKITREKGVPPAVGGIIGFAGGAAVGAIAGSSSSEANDSGGMPILLGAVAGGAAGGLVGWLGFMAMHDVEVLYDRTQAPRADLSLSVAPIVTARSKGAFLTVIW